jgi:hypothetical protein
MMDAEAKVDSGQEAQTIQAVAVLTLQPGDVLVARTRDGLWLTREAREAIGAQLRAAVPNNQILILEGGMDVQVLRPEDQLRRDWEVKLTGQAAFDLRQDARPIRCRFRLQDEGRAYPRSSCEACGRTVMSGLGKECQAVRAADVTSQGTAAAATGQGAFATLSQVNLGAGRHDRGWTVRAMGLDVEESPPGPRAGAWVKPAVHAIDLARDPSARSAIAKVVMAQVLGVPVAHPRGGDLTAIKNVWIGQALQAVDRALKLASWPTDPDPFRCAERALLGQRWTEEEGRQLVQLVQSGVSA